MLHYDTQNGLSDLNRTVQNTVRALQPHVGEFDSIVVQGTSGLVVGSPVSLLLNKPLVIVREDEQLRRCHHSRDVENALHVGRNVLFLDDQVSTGATLTDVEEKLALYTDANVTASYLYQYDEYRSPASHFSHDTSMWDLFKSGYAGL
jgi:adenine/guanine phosphoribosyltransferase-like PRPP-binding protein